MESLPQEVIGIIFNYAYPEVDVLNGTHAKTKSTSIWTLTCVTRSWRATAINTKALWTRLLVEDNQWATSPTLVILRICHVLSLSNPLLFSVRTIRSSPDNYPEGEFDSILGPIFANSHRLEAFIEDTDSHALQLFALSTFPFSELRTLRLNGEFSDGYIPTVKNPRPINAPILQNLEMLRFQLDDVTLRDFMSNLLFPWAQIKKLALESPDFDSVGQCTLEYVPHFLSNFPNLEEFTFTMGTNEDLDEIEGTTFSGGRLKKISIRARYPHLSSLLTRISAPNLSHLQIDLLEVPGDLSESEDFESTYSDSSGDLDDTSLSTGELDLLSDISQFVDKARSGTMVQLVLHGFQTLPILGIVKQCPNLQTLSVDQMDQDLVKYLTASKSRTGWRCNLPSLESLTWEFDRDATRSENRRILKMLHSRSDARAPLKLVRILYGLGELDRIKQVILDKLLDWREKQRSRTFCALELVCLEELEWKPLQLY